jgi:hypothetical protein
MDNANKYIPHEVASKLCAAIQQQFHGKWWTLAGMQCMGCTIASKGDQAKMCISNAPGFRGCNLVNARYDRINRQNNP